jgi:HK97 family phage prohead protease
MPYYISDSAEGCSGWATVKDDGEVMGCHETKQDAIDQALAIAQAEDSEYLGERAMPGSLNVGDFINWSEAGETYVGRIREIVTSGSVAVEGSGVQIDATYYDPAALVQMWEQVNGRWVESDLFLGLKFSQLSKTQVPAMDQVPEFEFDDDEEPEEAPEGYHYMPDGTLMADEDHQGERAAPDALVVDDFVSWNTSGGRARGQIERIVRDGTIDVPDSDFTIEGTEDDPAALIRVWREGEEGPEASETLVGHKFSTLTKIGSLRSIAVERRQVDLSPPAYMRAAARQGLRYHEEGLSGDGLRPQTVREARAMAEGNVSADKWVRLAAWIARHLGDLDSPAANPDNEDYPSAGVVAHLLWGSGPSKARARRALEYAERIVARLEEENRARFSVEARDMAKIETRTQATQFEVRELENGTGMTFSGYAAVFNSPSEPLPFREKIAPGAFTRSLNARNDIKMLWNHESGQVLGSTRAGTLRMEEDSYGLRVTADLPDTTAGRDAAYLLKRGDIDSMSFGFSVPKGGDDWSADGQERTLNSVRLHEVSIVAFPAYSATAGTTMVRGLDAVARSLDIDEDKIADALLKLESGQKINQEDYNIVNSVIDSLVEGAEAEAAPASEESDVDMLALKRKKLEQLLKGLE